MQKKTHQSIAPESSHLREFENLAENKRKRERGRREEYDLNYDTQGFLSFKHYCEEENGGEASLRSGHVE